NHPKPWRKQLNILLAYAYFYNPLRLAVSLVRPRGTRYLDEAIWQLLGMRGLAQTIRRTFGWMLRLRFGTIRRRSTPPLSRIPMRSAKGGAASHALPGTISATDVESNGCAPRTEKAHVVELIMSV